MTDKDDKIPIPTSQSYSDFGGTSNNEDFCKGLPNYLINPSKKGDIHDIMIDANEEQNETDFGYDSNCDTEEINNIDEELHLESLFKQVSVADQDSNKDIEVSDRNMVEMDVVKTQYGTQQGLTLHETPRDWSDPPPDGSRNKPQFKIVDNPGKWGSFCY